MVLCLGIEYNELQQQTCLMEHGKIIELRQFTATSTMLAYVEDVCASYPEPVVALAVAPMPLALHSWSMAEEDVLSLESSLYTRDGQARSDVRAIAMALEALNLTSYRIPTIKQMTSIPRYRKLNRDTMGTASVLCAVVTLLHRMRLQEAVWSEMRFLYVDIQETARSIIVVQDGVIVDGMTRPMHEALYQNEEGNAARQVVEAAFWEGLTQDMAALIALHHCEDAVLLAGPHEGLRKLRDTVIERLGDIYPCYLFPIQETEPLGYETVIGAATIAEGLLSSGEAAEVVAHLQLMQVERSQGEGKASATLPSPWLL